MTIPQLRAEILALGYSEDHAILQWGAGTDGHIFERILRDSIGGPLVEAPIRDRSARGVDVMRLLRSMVSRRIACSLQNAHRIICPDKPPFNPHKASEDVRAFGDIMERIVRCSMD